MTALTPRTGAQYARIRGVGAYRPSRVVTNDEICELIDSSDEWIRERSGIITRHFADADESVVDMAAAASEKALAAAGVRADEIDTVIVGTVTHLSQTPSAAAELAFRLGTGKPAAFDISAACAGFSYGLAIAQDLIRGGSATNVLLVGVEKLSDLTDPTDRSIAFIFGDGAGAVVLGPSDVPAIGPFSGDQTASRPRPSRRTSPGPHFAKNPPTPSPLCVCRVRRCSVGRSTRCPRWPSVPWTPQASRRLTWTSSSPTRPTCASPTP